MGDEDHRRLILARRARFVAAALAGVAASTTGCGKAEPCLSQVVNPDSGEPQPCLSPPYNPVDGGASDADADAGENLDAEPQPCLSPPIDRDQ